LPDLVHCLGRLDVLGGVVAGGFLCVCLVAVSKAG
jgi:hypothetical protein